MTDAMKVRRFYPLDAANGVLHRPGTYIVRYYDADWRIRELEVVATDELGAFTTAQHILKSKQRNPMAALSGAAMFVFLTVLGGLLGIIAMNIIGGR